MSLISVCIPSFNHGRFVGRSIESALAQTETDIEVLLIDDGSTDETLEVARQYHDPRFRISINPSRLGLGANFNRALDAAHGEYLKILCDDDLLYPGALKTLRDGLEANPSASFATSAWHVIDESARVLETKRLVPSTRETYRSVSLKEVARSSWLFRNVIGGPSSVLFRKALMREVHFRPAFKQMLDFECWLQLLRRGPLLYSPMVLSAYRHHVGTQSTHAWEQCQAADDLLAISIELGRERRQMEGAISLSDIKRLQFLCVLRAASGTVGSAARGNLVLAQRNWELCKKGTQYLRGADSLEGDRSAYP
ncbi:MAG: hypothetical protein DLM50_02070 [Candidatus Meridianibacter frigidus]|nr:MAG: hypothetical protein DLM50_02070 [Candidatus Eremiobacteraeota bacterium]